MRFARARGTAATSPCRPGRGSARAVGVTRGLGALAGLSARFLLVRLPASDPVSCGGRALRRRGRARPPRRSDLRPSRGAAGRCVRVHRSIPRALPAPVHLGTMKATHVRGPRAMPDSLVPRSLVWATNIDVLPPERIVRRPTATWRCARPPTRRHYWGNLLVFDEPRPRVTARAGRRCSPASSPTSRGWRTARSPGTGPTTSAARSTRVRGARVRRRAERRDDRDARTRSDPIPRQRRGQVTRARSRPGGTDERTGTRSSSCRRPGGTPATRGAKRPIGASPRAPGRPADDVRGAGAAPGTSRLTASQVVGSMGIVVTGGRGRYQAVDTALSSPPARHLLPAAGRRRAPRRGHLRRRASGDRRRP